MENYPLPGCIGKYDVKKEIGSGGMGHVYLATDSVTGREVAIKVLGRDFAGDPEMRARFHEEGRKTARLNHPNIVTAYEVDQDKAGMPFIVMEYVKGKSLDKLLNDGMPLLKGLRILIQIARALAYVHQNGLFHRDIKPHNIIVDPDGHAKLLDFGLACLEHRSQEIALTRPGHLICTVEYSSPERLRCETIDGSSDIYSLGVVLYRLIAGQLPFSGETYVLMMKILNENPPPLSACPDGLQSIIDRAIAKSPADRYKTADDMVDDIQPIIYQLEKKQAEELFPDAQRLVAIDELQLARFVLEELQEHENVEQRVKSLFKEVAKRQLELQAKEALVSAENAFRTAKLDERLKIIESGLKADPKNASLLALRETVHAQKRQREKIDALLHRVGSAREKGDYQGAIASAQEARRLDENNSNIVELCNAVSNEAEKAAHRKSLCDSARRLLESGSHEEALEVLRDEKLDQTDPEGHRLFLEIKLSLEEKRHRQLISRLKEALTRAVTNEELQLAATGIQEALVSAPEDSELLGLRTQANCRLNKHRNELHSRANAAFEEGRYQEAVRLLEDCKAEGLANHYTLSLLERARKKCEQHTKRNSVPGEIPNLAQGAPLEVLRAPAKSPSLAGISASPKKRKDKVKLLHASETRILSRGSPVVTAVELPGSAVLEVSKKTRTKTRGRNRTRISGAEEVTSDSTSFVNRTRTVDRSALLQTEPPFAPARTTATSHPDSKRSHFWKFVNLLLMALLLLCLCMVALRDHFGQRHFVLRSSAAKAPAEPIQGVQDQNKSIPTKPSQAPLPEVVLSIETNTPAVRGVANRFEGLKEKVSEPGKAGEPDAASSAMPSLTEVGIAFYKNKQYEQAKAPLRAGCDNGDSEACYYFAHLLQLLITPSVYGGYTDRDLLRAQKRSQAQCEKRQMSACWMVAKFDCDAQINESRFGTTIALRAFGRDECESFSFHACHPEPGDSCLVTGFFLARGYAGFPIDQDEASYYFEEGCALGSHRACAAKRGDLLNALLDLK